eukprot:m.386927 g.386927  ORF g.386927 m.386927 type:complete len:81 (-) comp159166_c0_seq1:127-369(-)
MVKDVLNAPELGSQLFTARQATRPTTTSSRFHKATAIQTQVRHNIAQCVGRIEHSAMFTSTPHTATAQGDTFMMLQLNVC